MNIQILNNQKKYTQHQKVQQRFITVITPAYNMDPLVELPVHQWPLLRQKLRAKWPMNVAGYYALYLNEKRPEVREAFEFKVYCPFGDMDNGFVSINFKSPETQDIIVFSITDETNKLEEALLKTKLIHWSKKVYIELVNSRILRSLYRVKKIIGLENFDVGILNTYLFSSEATPFEDMRAPPNTRVAPVSRDHIYRVDQTWPYRCKGSLKYFSILASNHLSYGLYYNDELLAWVFINKYNFLCHLYCEEGHRGKGFAEYLLKFVVNEELRRGNDVYAYVLSGNKASMRLFEKLGFKNIDLGAYIFAQK